MGRITASRTQLKGDPVYDSLLASKFINCMMWDGKKTVAQKIFYDCLGEIKKRVPIRILRFRVQSNRAFRLGQREQSECVLLRISGIHFRLVLVG